MSKGDSSRYTGGNGYKTPMGVKFACTMPLDTFDKLNRIAMRKDVSIACVVRQILAEASESEAA